MNDPGNGSLDDTLVCAMVEADRRRQLVTVRAATLDDVDRLLGLWTVAAENTSRPTDSAAGVRVLIERDQPALLVAVAEGYLIGSVIAGWDGWRAHLYRLCVAPPWRGLGVAQQLVAAAKDRLTLLGATRLDAMVLAGNVDGERFWAAAGFEPQGEWRRWVRSQQSFAAP